MKKFGVILPAAAIVAASLAAALPFIPIPLASPAYAIPSPNRPATTSASGLKLAYFGAGCFWKVQYIFSNTPGVVKTKAGYSGGLIANPTYEQVCGHTTKHVETVQVEYDPKKISYKKLLEVFWAHHDPTTLNRQGPDVGDQYRSVIFYTDDQQKQEALEVKKELTEAHRFSKPIVTAIEPASKFYDAEDYHQDYFKKHGQVCE